MLHLSWHLGIGSISGLMDESEEPSADDLRDQEEDRKRPVKRFAIHPGWVNSAHDNDRHFVMPHELMRLYRVRPIECIIYDERYPLSLEGRKVYDDGLLHLYPMKDWYVPVSDNERALYPIPSTDMRRFREEHPELRP
jgi:hypothetical protein